nr:DUF3883 domain-containing protein [Nitrosomonas nitrosa]
MANGEDWSRIEVETCVADYLRMLTLYLNGQRFSKTEHAKALMTQLNRRSRSSVEFKHCNISAVLTELGVPYLPGYLPRRNFQALLLDVVEDQLARNPELRQAAEAAVERPAAAIKVLDDSDLWVPPPIPLGPSPIHQSPPAYGQARESVRPLTTRDYLAQEARNRSLGAAGEAFVLEVEARRLHAAGKRTLADRVEHVAVTRGDGLGYDIQSFEEDGRERLIEVKTTSFGKLTPFFVSRNELSRSESDAPVYHLYRVFDFRSKPRVFQLPGAIKNYVRLVPISYLAQFPGGDLT